MPAKDGVNTGRSVPEIVHVNRVLRAIRNVNQLISREKNRAQFLRKACALLIETNGYGNVWIALRRDGKFSGEAYESGVGDAFHEIAARLARGELIDCVERALAADGPVAVADPGVECHACPLASMYPGRAALAIRLDCGGKCYGLMSASMPRALFDSPEEQSLFAEVAGDIAFALSVIESEEEKRALADAEAQAAYNLGERIKELNCLYELYVLLDENLPLAETLERACALLPRAFRYPEHACCRISLPPGVYATGNFEQTEWRLAADVTVDGRAAGGIEVCYRQRFPDAFGGPFLAEEQKLLDAFAGRLGKAVQQIRSEGSLRHEQELVQRVMEASPVGITLVDRNGRIRFANERAEQILALERASVVGRAYNDPRWRILSINSVPLPDECGNFDGMVSSLDDITDDIRREDEFRTIFDMSLSLLCVADIRTATFIRVNPAFTRTLGYSPAELTGRSFLDFVHPDDREETARIVGEELRKGKQVINFENRYRAKDGTYRHLVWVSHPRPEDGLTYAVATDMTERIVAEKELRENYETIKSQNALTAALLDGAHAVLQNMDFSTTARHIFESCKKFTGATAGYVALLSDDGSENEVLFLDSGGIPCTVDPNLPMPIRGLRAEAYTSGKTVYDNDFAASEWMKFMPPGHARLENVMFTPLAIENRVVGLIGLANKPGGFDEKDAATATAFGGIASVALKNHRNVEKLAASESLLERTGRMARVGGWELDARTRKVTWTAETYRIHELAPDVSPPLTAALGFFHPDDRPTLAGAIEAALAHGKPYDLELRFTTAQGRNLWVQTNCTPIFENGEVVRIEGTIQDITGRKAAELALTESEEHFRNLFENTSLGVAVYAAVDDGRDFVFTDINPAGEKYSRVKKSDIVGKKITAVFPGVTEMGLLGLLERAWRTGERQHLPLVLYKDDRIDEMVENHIFRLPSGKVVAFYEDKTEQFRLEERLRQAEKLEAIGRLAGGIAHDFNNQLQGIMGNCEMLKMRLPDAGLEKYVDNAVISIRRAAELTQQLLAFARKGQYRSVPVDIHETVREVAMILSHTIDRRIRIVQQLAAANPFVKGDPTQLQNMLLNLALNARDAMPDGGELAFRTEIVTLDRADCESLSGQIEPAEYLSLKVADTGCGMTERVRQRIFEPFFTTKEVGAGSGMGLAAVYGTVKAHRGAIEVTSTPGKGATFTIFLPLTGTKRDECPVTAASVGRSTQPSRVLVVDDEAMFRNVVSDLLVQMGHEVSTAEDGEAAVRHYAQHWRETDLVILDMIMPRMNGVDAFFAMRAINPDARVLLASGYSVDGMAQSLLDRGAAGFLQKPFKAVELENAILRIVVPAG